MIDFEYGQPRLVCDCCGKTVKGFETFDEAREYAKDEGWQTKKVNGEWENYCPVCKECAEI